jgi:hypothetical protein
MVIDENNVQLGVDATAYYLCFFMHVMKERGITNDQSAYIHYSINVVDHLEAIVTPAAQPDVDQVFLRSASLVALVSKLTDALLEGRMSDPFPQAYYKALIASWAFAEPEIAMFILLVNGSEDPRKFREILDAIYRKYVFTWWRSIGEAE